MHEILVRWQREVYEKKKAKYYTRTSIQNVIKDYTVLVVEKQISMQINLSPPILYIYIYNTKYLRIRRILLYIFTTTNSYVNIARLITRLGMFFAHELNFKYFSNIYI